MTPSQRPMPRSMPRWKRLAVGAGCVGAALACGIGVPMLSAQAQSAPVAPWTKTAGALSDPGFEAPQMIAVANSAKDTPWEDLVPKGWNPMANFKAPPNMGMLSDADPRVMEMMKELRETWDNAPTRPELDGKAVQLSGYIVPLEQVKGELKEFLLVPYFGACIHTPPPPANQIVHVLPSKGGKGLRAMDVVTVRGALKTARTDSSMGASGYRIDGAIVDLYTPLPTK